MTEPYESVYSTHKDRVIEERGEVVTREAYNHPPRDAQGTVIERMKAHASTEITREDLATMNCAIFIDLVDVCAFIEDAEKLGNDRAYPALCDLGRDRCYHEFKRNDNRDVFSDITEMVSIGKRSVDSPSKRAAARTPMSIFDDVHTTKFRTTKQTLAIAVDHAKEIGIRTSHLNLYHALVGLKYLVENEPDYILLAEKTLFVDALRPLIKADRILNERRELLQVWMAI